MLKTFVNSDEVVRDAALERLRHYRQRRVLLRGARSGSFEVAALVAAVSYFVLERTIGEAVADGFKETRVYSELKEFFRGLVDEKHVFIADAIRRSFTSKKRDVRVTAASPPDQPHRIVVEIPPAPREGGAPPAPTLGDILDRSGHTDAK